MAGKDSQEGADSVNVELAATRPPQKDGDPQGAASVPVEGGNDVLNIVPTDIAIDAVGSADLPTDLQSSDPEIINDGQAPIDGSWADPSSSAASSQGDTLQPTEIMEVDSSPEGDFDLDSASPAEDDRTSARDAEPWDLHPHQLDSPDIAAPQPVQHPSRQFERQDEEPPIHETEAADVQPDQPPGEVALPADGVDGPFENTPAPVEARRMDLDASAVRGETQFDAYDERAQAPEAASVSAPFTASATATDAPTTAPEGRGRKALTLIKSGARYAAIGAAGYLAFVALQILAYRIVDPPGSTLMLMRLLSGTWVERTWVPIERISPNLVRAVIVSEDGRFCDHWGIDIEAMREAIRRSGDSTPRGASTISMQVTKNLFLWPSKSYFRKVIELPLTALIELVWPKRRILEIYLNIAEWGPGIFGAEAAARHHFRKPASRLSEREAALLAASLPNPVRRDAGDPGPATSRKARVVQARMHMSGPVAACVIGNR